MLEDKTRLTEMKNTRICREYKANLELTNRRKYKCTQFKLIS